MKEKMTNKKINIVGVIGIILILIYEILPIQYCGEKRSGFLWKNLELESISIFQSFFNRGEVSPEVITNFVIIDILLIMTIVLLIKKKNIFIFVISILIFVIRINTSTHIRMVGDVLPFSHILDVIGMLLLLISSLIYTILDVYSFIKYNSVKKEKNLLQPKYLIYKWRFVR